MDAPANNTADVVRQQTGEVVVYPLNVPIILMDGTELKSIRLRRPTGKELRHMKISGGVDIGVLMDLVAATNGYTSDEMDKLDGSDVFAIVEIVGPFLESGPGKKPSQ